MISRLRFTRAYHTNASRVTGLPRLRSLDLLVGAQQNRWRYGQAKCLGGLEVHNHLKFCRKLHREIARLLAAQDAIDIGGGATPAVCPVGSVGEQAAVFDKVRLR